MQQEPRNMLLVAVISKDHIFPQENPYYMKAKCMGLGVKSEFESQLNLILAM